jgi:methionyl-tRNA formyltransferase
VTTHTGKLLRVWRATPMAAPRCDQPGKVVNIDKLGAWVETGDGHLVLQEVQPAGGRRMDIAAYARGHALRPGDVLGTC